MIAAKGVRSSASARAAPGHHRLNFRWGQNPKNSARERVSAYPPNADLAGALPEIRIVMLAWA